jgi:hypothetical protein
MSTAAPSENRTANQTSGPHGPGSPAGPPEEAFWVRYSPHHELPLSGVGSFALHALGIGLLILLGVLASMFGFDSKRQVPVEPVKLKITNPGGGGSKEGKGTTNPGGPKGTEKELAGSTSGTEDPLDPDPDRPRLDPTQVAALPPEIKNDPAAARYIQKGAPNLAVFSRVNKEALQKFRSGLQDPGKGQGGTGSGGGQGTGTGTGTGSGTGEGKAATLSQREKRMLRWVMMFDTQNAADYVHQLQSLGAILAIPTPDGRDYRIIRDLSRRPAQLLHEDLSRIQCIYWTDANPRTVGDVARYLGLPRVPPHFVAFMPEKLEKKLFEMERAFAGRAEDEIFETRFKVERRGGGYEPRVVYQRPK